jgi:hypothetical protein
MLLQGLRIALGDLDMIVHLGSRGFGRNVRGQAFLCLLPKVCVETVRVATLLAGMKCVVSDRFLGGLQWERRLGFLLGSGLWIHVEMADFRSPRAVIARAITGRHALRTLSSEFARRHGLLPCPIRQATQRMIARRKINARVVLFDEAEFDVFIE